MFADRRDTSWSWKGDRVQVLTTYKAGEPLAKTLDFAFGRPDYNKLELITPTKRLVGGSSE